MMRTTARGIAALIITILLGATAANAKEGDGAVEAIFLRGTESFEGLGGQKGGSVGVGYEFVEKIQVRLDVSRFKSDATQNGLKIKATRVPVNLGMRYLFPDTGLKNLTAYGQGAVELSFDRTEIDHGTAETTNEDANLGVAVGGGVEYLLAPPIGVNANILYHAVDSGYFAFGAGVSVRF